MRLALKKYKEPEICKTFEEALEKLILENISLYKKVEWQEFRDEKSNTPSINALLHANSEGLNKISTRIYKIITVEK